MNGACCLIDKWSRMLLVVNKWRGFKVRQNVGQVANRTVHLVLVKVFLQLVPVGQHGRRQDGCIRPKGVGVGWIRWPSHHKADVVAGTTKHCSDAFAPNTLQPMFVDLKRLRNIFKFMF